MQQVFTIHFGDRILVLSKHVLLLFFFQLILDGVDLPWGIG